MMTMNDNSVDTLDQIILTLCLDHDQSLFNPYSMEFILGNTKSCICIFYNIFNNSVVSCIVNSMTTDGVTTQGDQQPC